jgi:Mce-associated membrane protein
VTLSTECDEDTIDEAVDPAPGDESGSGDDNQQPRPTTQHERRFQWSRVLCFGVLPLIVVILAVGAGYLKWLSWSQGQETIAQTESVRAATDATVAMLSYKPDTVNNDLDAAKSRLTGSFRDSYSSLTADVVAPAAIQKLITAKAQVPAAASVSANARHAVVLVFVNQTVTVGNDAPSNTASSVRITLDRIDGHWLISGFDPV